MQAIIKIYSKRNQSKKDSVTNEVTKSVATVNYDTLTYTAKNNVKVKDQLAQIEHFVTRVIGARYKAAIALDKRAPSTMFFSVSLNGRVFQSETSLVKANMLNAVAVSTKSFTGKDGKVIDGNAIIERVAAIQIKGIRTSVAYLNDVARIAKESEGLAKMGAKEQPAMSLMTSDDLVGEAEPVTDVEVTPATIS